jgi:hypothetical protein
MLRRFQFPQTGCHGGLMPKKKTINEIMKETRHSREGRADIGSGGGPRQYSQEARR